jgi:asparagine N-glycosylation enzyme membrane subunit Stt3
MSKKMKVYYYPLVLIAAAIIFIFIYRAVQPGVFQNMLTQFSLFAPTGSTAATTLEMEPFLYPQGSFNTAVAWGNFTTSFFLLSPEMANTNLIWFPSFGIIPIILSIWLYRKRRNDNDNSIGYWVAIIMMIGIALWLWFGLSPEWKVRFPGFGFWGFVILVWDYFKRPESKEHWLLFIIWSLVILLATFGQRRFAYYLVINIAMLSAYFSWRVGWLIIISKMQKYREIIANVIYRYSRNIALTTGIALIIFTVSLFIHTSMGARSRIVGIRLLDVDKI